MSPLYVYALLGAAPTVPLGAGLQGEPLRTLACDGLVAVVGTVASAPALDATGLRGHDAVVRRLADMVEAVLPARFGSLIETEEILAERLATTRTALQEALELVAGREQMVLRLYGPTPPPPAPEAPDAEGSGVGARYLARRLRAAREERGVAELAPLRSALAALVVAERVQRHRTPPLLATVYHLLARGASAGYVRVVEEGRGLIAVRLGISGPWPPYAFAPDQPS